MKIKNVNIDVCRLKAGIKSVSALSAKCGISRNSLSSYSTIKGFENMTMKTAIQLCEAMNCRFEDLVEFEYDRN